MGFNIAGLVINQNFDKDINKLSKDLKWGIEVLDEISFEEASSNWTPEGEFRLYFSDKATMIFFPHEWVAERNRSRTADTLNYAYSESVMAFQVDFFRRGKLVRSILEHEGEKKMEVGEPLELEKENESVDTLTFALIDELLGNSFNDIDLSEKAFRCKKTPYVETDENEIKKEKLKEALQKSPALRAIVEDKIAKRNAAIPNLNQTPKTNATEEISPVKTNIKKWWQFWK